MALRTGHIVSLQFLQGLIRCHGKEGIAKYRAICVHIGEQCFHRIEPVILLNKTDLVSEDELEKVEAKITSINRYARIHRAKRSHRVDGGSRRRGNTAIAQAAATIIETMAAELLDGAS